MLNTDASDLAVGAVLQQEHDGDLKPVAFFSRKLNPAERKYSTYKKECLAFVCALKHFRVYLLGKPFVARTDHRALLWLESHEPESGGIVARWITLIQEFPMTLEHVKGKDNIPADALSRTLGWEEGGNPQ